MNSQPCLYAALLALSRRSTSISARNVLRRKLRLLSRLAAPAILLLLLALSQQSLTAQQAWSPGYSNNAQCTPAPQPGYAQPQPYDPQQTYIDPDPQQDYNSVQPQQPNAQPLNAEQLEQLVAPIALYPDTLVAQILAAATYPAQVVDADHWRQAQGNVSPEEIVAGANAQAWDPSLKALAAFPQVLSEMDQNLRWTIALGNAYYNQPQDVLDVVQVMRRRAQAAGNLQSTPQEAVSYDQGYIQVAPTNPQVVYLPVYNPWSAYGQPVEPYRGFSWVGTLGSAFSSLYNSGAVRYGLGIAMSAFSHTPWGWLGWGLDWLSHSLLFNNSNYYSHSTTVTDRGFPYGGPRARYGGGYQHASINGLNGHGYGNTYRQQENYGRPGAGYGAGHGGGYDGYNHSRSQEFQQQPQRFAENRPAPGDPRGYPGSSYPGAGYARPPMEAYNRSLAQRNTPQPYGRPAPTYGSGFYNRPGGERYDTRPGISYAPPSQSYRVPQSNYPHAGSPGPASGFYGNGSRGMESYAPKPQKSGGFHLFGGGHEREPKGFGSSTGFSSKGFSSHHSGGGGHSSSHGGGGHHH